MYLKILDKLGPRAPEIREFMTNPKNYIFEPSGPNRARGARNDDYRDPHKD
jgi:hypothetical protein